MKKRIPLLSILFLIFIIFVIFIKMDRIFLIDRIFYKRIISIRTDMITEFFKIITKLGTTKICFIIGIILVIIFRKKIYLWLPITTVIIKIMNVFMKLLINRPRPNVMRLVYEKETSFPSGHAMLSITLYGLLIYFIYSKISKNSVKWILITGLSSIILLVGISRIYLGVHYTTDIIGGYLLGMIYLVIITNYMKG